MAKFIGSRGATTAAAPPTQSRKVKMTQRSDTNDVRSSFVEHKVTRELRKVMFDIMATKIKRIGRIIGEKLSISAPKHAITEQKMRINWSNQFRFKWPTSEALTKDINKYSIIRNYENARWYNSLPPEEQAKVDDNKKKAEEHERQQVLKAAADAKYEELQKMQKQQEDEKTAKRKASVDVGFEEGRRRCEEAVANNEWRRANKQIKDDNYQAELQAASAEAEARAKSRRAMASPNLLAELFAYWQSPEYNDLRRQQEREYLEFQWQLELWKQKFGFGYCSRNVLPIDQPLTGKRLPPLAGPWRKATTDQPSTSNLPRRFFGLSLPESPVASTILASERPSLRRSPQVLPNMQWRGGCGELRPCNDIRVPASHH